MSAQHSMQLGACLILAMLGPFFAACNPGAAGAEADAQRIAALESKVQRLEALLGGARAELGFDIDCPAAWQRLGAVGDTVWTCRQRRALPDGFWPNCNVALGTVDHDPATRASLSPRASFERSLASAPALRGARRISERATVLGAAPAYEAVYDHDLLPRPLRVLATFAVHAEQVYSISCAAPPTAFAALESVFREVTSSFRFAP